MALEGWVTLSAAAQDASYTASRDAYFSLFAGGTGTFTGLSGGRNGGVTAGLDFSLPKYFGIRPSAEVRGTVPFYRGNVDSQRNILGGVRAETDLGRFHPYGDFLIGRGAQSFHGAYVTFEGGFLYGKATTTVLSPGVGLRYSLSNHFSAFGDLQVQHWDTPASLSGHLFAKAITFGLVYRFTYGHRGEHRR